MGRVEMPNGFRAHMAGLEVQAAVVVRVVRDEDLVQLPRAHLRGAYDRSRHAVTSFFLPNGDTPG